jgi:hypothetical protein
MLIRDVLRLAPRRTAPITLPSGTTVGPSAPLLEIERLALTEYDALKGDASTRAEYVAALSSTLGVDVTPLLDGRVWHCMTPDTVRALADEGFGMQLHTHSHLNVVDYPLETAGQVHACRAIVERTTGHAAQHFCYPSGRWTKSIWPALQGEGVLTATTTRSGPNLPSTPLLALRRLMNGEDRSQLEFEFELSNLRWLLARLFGKTEASIPSEKTRAYRETGEKF